MANRVSRRRANDATGASNVREPSVHVANARATDAGARPNNSNTWDDIQPSQDSRGHRL
jgi:hypothetical protein